MPETAYNPRAPELTAAEADDVVDAFLHTQLDGNAEIEDRLQLILTGTSRRLRAAVTDAWQRRLDRYKSIAHRIHL